MQLGDLDWLAYQQCSSGVKTVLGVWPTCIQGSHQLLACQTLRPPACMRNGVSCVVNLHRRVAVVSVEWVALVFNHSFVSSVLRRICRLCRPQRQRMLVARYAGVVHLVSPRLEDGLGMDVRQCTVYARCRQDTLIKAMQGPSKGLPVNVMERREQTLFHVLRRRRGLARRPVLLLTKLGRLWPMFGMHVATVERQRVSFEVLLITVVLLHPFSMHADGMGSRALPVY